MHLSPPAAALEHLPTTFGSQAALELFSGCEDGSHPHATCVADPQAACVVVLAWPFASAADAGGSVVELLPSQDAEDFPARKKAALARAAEEAVARANATHPNVLLLEPGQWPGQHLDWCGKLAGHG